MLVIALIISAVSLFGIYLIFYQINLGYYVTDSMGNGTPNIFISLFMMTYIYLSQIIDL